MGGALSRATASDEVKGEGGQEGEGHGYVQTFTVSDISEATSYVFDLKKLQKERTGERKENNTTFLAEASASPHHPQQRDRDIFLGSLDQGSHPA